MKKIQIVEYGEKQCHAGTKAVEDVSIIAEKMGFTKMKIQLKTQKLTFIAKIYRQLAYITDWLMYGKKVDNAILLLQFPFIIKTVNRKFILDCLKKNNVKIITVIHDVEELRGYMNNSYMERDFKLILQYSDIFIVHNEKMKCFFISKGIPQNRIVVLDIFDYLYVPQESKEIRFSKSIVIAGNLNKQKSPYIEQLGILKDINIVLYGPNYDESGNCKNMNYCGSVNPEKLPQILNEGFGLVWDGTSIETCDGPSGNYLKYNNPHKLSLYLAAGLPVIIWKQAAEAEFVEGNGVGICVNSLYELEKILDDISAEQYEQMCRNVKMVGKKLAHGEYMTKAIKKAIDLLGE